MIRFVVAGEAVPKGSKSAFVRQRLVDGEVVHEAVMVDGRRSKHRDRETRLERNRWMGTGPHSWVQRATDEAFAARIMAGRVPRGPLNVRAEFYLHRPKNRQPGGPCATKPDLDKLLRGLLDPMTKSGLIIDDSWVCSFDGSRKLYDDGFGPRVVVELSEATWALGPLLSATRL